MSEWLKLERLDFNELPEPKFATEQAAGLDIAACLTRPCMLVTTAADHDGPQGPRVDSIPCDAGHSIKSKFWCCQEGRRTPYSELDSISAPAENPVLIIAPHETILVPTGFKSEFDGRYVLTLYARSSVAISGLMLANNVAVVDSDYRGEIFVPLWNRTTHPIVIAHGQRVAQGVLVQFSRPIIKETTVNTTKRGEGGFGSTGRAGEDARVLAAINQASG